MKILDVIKTVTQTDFFVVFREPVKKYRTRIGRVVKNNLLSKVCDFYRNAWVLFTVKIVVTSLPSLAGYRQYSGEMTYTFID